MSGKGTAIGYVRVSTDEQSKNGVSLDAQKAALRRYADANGWHLETIFEDAGFSGKDLNRAGLMELLERAKKKDVRAVLVVKVDRLTRETADAIGLVFEIRKNGAELITVEDGKIDTNDPTQELLFTIKAALAKYERAIMIARTKFAMARLKAKGRRIGSVPFGYQLAGDGRHLVENAAEQKILAIIHELQEDGFTLREIATELNRQGHLTRKGTAWKHQYIHNQTKAAKRRFCHTGERLYDNRPENPLAA